MLHCKNCMLLCSGNVCPNCGTKDLCEPKDDDPVYLTTKDVIWSGAIEDILKKNHIPYLKRGLLGTALALKMGYGAEHYQFFVPYTAYEKSQELLGAIFVDEM